MANEQDQLTQVARERADKRIDAAIGDLHKAAVDIGRKHGIPEGISGHSVDDLLGRMAYIPSMARELRRALAHELTKQEIDRVVASAPVESLPSAPPTLKIDPSMIHDAIPVSLDVGDLEGVTVQTVKALRAAGLNCVGDVVVVPDEHLVKVNGLGAKSVQQIRAAIAKAAAQKGP